MEPVLSGAAWPCAGCQNAAQKPTRPHDLRRVQPRVRPESRKLESAPTRVAELGAAGVRGLFRASEREGQAGRNRGAARVFTELSDQEPQGRAHPSVIHDAIVAEQAVDLDEARIHAAFRACGRRIPAHLAVRRRVVPVDHCTQMSELVEQAGPPLSQVGSVVRPYAAPLQNPLAGVGGAADVLLSNGPLSNGPPELAPVAVKLRLVPGPRLAVPAVLLERVRQAVAGPADTGPAIDVRMCPS